ncbi:NEDD8-specific protease 2 [Cytospora mali]|uniref:NEDD8-specific protease 2 n=1 Tax=Cytospora mali TaxID=578113 RepID=A0A194VPV6_CYTMA|nr:NEDD8-specific protease 2 [Valsa mali]
MPFRDRVARRFGETPRIGTGSGLGLGCNRNRATARHDRRDDTRCNIRSNCCCCCCCSEGEKIARKALGPQHQTTKIIKNGKPQTCRGRRRPLATTGRSSSPITRRSSSRRSASSSSSSSSSCSSRFTARSFHSRVTRASSRLTDENGKQLSPTAPYLSFTYEDIKALRSDWLTDNNIAFWEEWLEREILPKYPQARICLLRPSMTYLLMRVDNDPQGIRSALPDMTKVTHIFLPINDAVSRTQPDGSHWSLLLVSKIDGVAFHYDSLGGANNGEGQRAADRLGRLMGMPLRYQSIQDCPQQENGNDCGVFVCILMRHLLVKKLLNANAREKVSMSMSNKMIDALGARKEMIKIIESLRKEGERRRSASPYAKQDGAPRID